MTASSRVKPIRRSGTSKQLRLMLYHVLMALGSFVMLYPLIWMVSSSVKPNTDIFTTSTQLIPQAFTAEHYITGWKGFAGYTFTVFFGNSLFIAVLVMLGTIASSSFVAFGFARMRFPGRNIWFVAMITTMLLPGQVMMIPRFVLFNRMGWVGTYLPMVVPAFFGGAFNIFLVMQFIRGIPREMDEAAKIDGCSWYGIFLKIIVPLIVPALVTVGVLAFIGSWEDFMGALLYLNKPSRYTAAYALKLFNDNTKVDYGSTFAMSVISLVPILTIFFFFQKNLVEGISLQGLKG